MVNVVDCRWHAAALRAPFEGTMIPNAAICSNARRAQGFAGEDQQSCGNVINGNKPSARKLANPECV